jgi:hypothetical protein
MGMSRARMMIVASAVALACSAGASASASASGSWFVNYDELASEQTAALATTAALDQNVVVKFSGVTVTCSGALNGVAPQLEGPSTSSAHSLAFTECTASGGKCALGATRIGTLPVTAETTLEGALGTQSTLKPQTGTLLATIKLTGSECVLGGETLPIKGTLHTSYPTGQDERTLQLLNLNATSGSEELKVGTATGSLTGSALLKLASSTPWGFSILGPSAPNPINFGLVTLGSEKSKVITVTAHSIATSYGVAGIDKLAGEEFEIVQNSCSGGGNFNENATCEITVAYRPFATTNSARLLLNWKAGAVSPQRQGVLAVTLEGTSN